MAVNEVDTTARDVKPGQSGMRRETLWAVAGSVALGLLPGTVLLQDMMTGRFRGSAVSSVCFLLGLPGMTVAGMLYLTGPFAIVIAILANMLFYFGVGWALVGYIGKGPGP
jgi:hypothetical protein